MTGNSNNRSSSHPIRRITRQIDENLSSSHGCLIVGAVIMALNFSLMWFFRAPEQHGFVIVGALGFAFIGVPLTLIGLCMIIHDGVKRQERRDFVAEQRRRMSEASTAGTGGQGEQEIHDASGLTFQAKRAEQAANSAIRSQSRGRASMPTVVDALQWLIDDGYDFKQINHYVDMKDNLIIVGFSVEGEDSLMSFDFSTRGIRGGVRVGSKYVNVSDRAEGVTMQNHIRQLADWFLKENPTAVDPTKQAQAREQEQERKRQMAEYDVSGRRKYPEITYQ